MDGLRNAPIERLLDPHILFAQQTIYAGTLLCVRIDLLVMRQLLKRFSVAVVVLERRILLREHDGELAWPILTRSTPLPLDPLARVRYGRCDDEHAAILQLVGRLVHDVEVVPTATKVVRDRDAAVCACLRRAVPLRGLIDHLVPLVLEQHTQVVALAKLLQMVGALHDRITDG